MRTVPAPFPLWESLAAACLAVVAAFVSGVLAGIPTVIALGSPKEPGDVGSNVIEAAFYLGGAAVLIPLLQRLSQRSLAELGVRALRSRDWILVVASITIVLLLQGAYQFVLIAAHQQNHIQAGFEHFRVTSPLAAAMVLLNGAVIAPVVEELFFRGLLFNALSLRMPILLAAVISGAFFGIAHGDFVLFPVLAIFGIVQALAYRIGGNLVVPMIVHGLNNGIFLSLMIAIPGFH